MLDFPDNPARGDQFAPMGGQVWVWTGSWWDLVREAGNPFVDAPEDGQTYGRLTGTWAPAFPLSGGPLAGALDLYADPVSPMEAATQNYVELQVNSLTTNANAHLSGNYVTYAYLGNYYTAGQSEQRMVDYYYALVNHVEWLRGQIQGATGMRWVGGHSDGGPEQFISGWLGGTFGNMYYVRILQFFIWGGWYTVGPP